ncbi:TRAP transporter small permease [Algibacter mikhailovii]|uniref:Tripartite ATP-independent periplasmic transporters DctQ component domain-containing protein n=1 Tax=Algibacter mikhailovii TaxID=425498 RepID=A0A918QZD4_9FLAO|nr:TRAP transporter small permease subunit [Algibacter mikhailovii]GGZ77366.1 hypothetical protein GCM10007028_13290 [Algibacter mikhailovii]
MKPSKTIGRILKFGTLWSTSGFVFTVVLQIYARFFLENAPSWTEEASRLFFIYAIAFASGLALKNNYYVHLDMFFNRFNPKIKRRILFAIPFVTFILFGLIMIFSIQLIILGMPERSPSMEFNMGFAFFSIFIMSSAICYYALIQILQSLKSDKK